MEGVLLVDKPVGLTSFDVVHKVRNLVRKLGTIRKPKVGHTGTLDPFATGVLPICIGGTTKLSQFLIEADKRYRATMRLGEQTNTDDSEGEVIKKGDLSSLVPETVHSAILALKGTHQQVPPQFSAIRIRGKRAYELARAGEVVHLEPRPITIHQVSVSEPITFPDVVFEVHASKGTYIRALCRDLGEELGCGAHCVGLRRLDAAGFDEKETITLDALLSLETREEFERHLVSPWEMLRGLPAYQATEEQTRALSHGRLITPTTPFAQETPIRVSNPEGKLICVAMFVPPGRLKPRRVLANQT